MTATISPNMGLIVPTVSGQPGPDWAGNVNADLGIIDQHTHAPGQGIQITPAGININTAFPFNDFDATLLRSARFSAQLTPLADPLDLGCVYVSGEDLYYNDTIGNQIRITQSGNVAGSTGTITGLPSGTASASYNSGTSTFVFQSATNTPANIDGATYLLRELTASPNAVSLRSPTGLAGSYNFVFPTALPVSNSFLAIDNSGNVSNTIPVLGALTTSNLSASAGILKSQLAAVGQQLSSSSSTFTTSSTTFTDVTNLTVTITTTGRPVMLGIVPDGSTVNFSEMKSVEAATGTAQLDVAFLEATNVIGLWRIAVTNTANAPTASAPVSSFNMIYPVAAGTYTFKVQVKVGAFGSETASVSYCKLFAYEL